MGKKRRKNKNRGQELFQDDEMHAEFESTMRNQGIKQKSKVGKKMKKKLQKMEQRKRNFNIAEAKIEGMERCGFHMVTASFKGGDPSVNKQFLLSSIKNYVDDPFIAYGNFIGEDSFSFYMDANKNIAEAIKSLSKKIQTSNGKVITFKVAYVTETDFILNCDQIDLLKIVVLKRYNQEAGLLNLSSLHLDNAFLETNTFAPLSNQRIFKGILTIVKDNLPSISALDLSGNKLCDSCHEPLKAWLCSHSGNLTALNLANNNLKNLRSLESLRQFPLKELRLLNNLYPESKGSSKTFIKVVRKILPFLKMLDECDLTELILDPRKANFVNLNAASMKSEVLPANNVTSITEENVKTFLEQYYSLFDTAEKVALIQAYVPTAKIELRSQNPLFPTKNFEGFSEIQEFLNSWPESKHDHSSFKLEILNLSPMEGVCQIEGSCGFVQSGATAIFKRVMKIVPFNSGFCCVADMLCLL